MSYYDDEDNFNDNEIHINGEVVVLENLADVLKVEHFIKVMEKYSIEQIENALPDK